MTWETWSVFALTTTALSLTPGPAVLLVLSQALSRGALKSVWSSFGILAANACYFLFSATSLGALLLTSYNVFFAIKWIGSAYLIWLGLKTFFSKSSVVSVNPAEDTRSSNSRLFLNGFVLQAANPKALLFFTALIPQFINPMTPIAPQVTTLAMTTMLIEFLVLVSYGILAGQATYLATSPRFAQVTNRGAGLMLVGAGVGIATTSRK